MDICDCNYMIEVVWAFNRNVCVRIFIQKVTTNF